MSCLPENHVYSYSQLSSVDECPYSYYEERIDQEPKELLSNFFAEHGTLIHKVLEMWANQEITKEDMAEQYALLYPDFVVTPPPGYMSAYRQKAYSALRAETSASPRQGAMTCRGAIRTQTST